MSQTFRFPFTQSQCNCSSRFRDKWSNLAPSMGIISNSRDSALCGDESGRYSFFLVTDKISDERQKENHQHKNYRFPFIGKILFFNSKRSHPNNIGTVLLRSSKRSTCSSSGWCMCVIWSCQEKSEEEEEKKKAVAK